ncbi:MAG TPA: hypothetical protein VKK61_05265, partial [Tepidisphaeraceae bacterium]|nr:hypothetical protein [Tepidisphaeraceae bacterium]
SPDDSWSMPTIVAPFATQQLQAFPSNNAPQGVLWAFLQWADQHTPDIIQPTFYQVLKGDGWSVPGAAAVALAPQAFDPNNYIDASDAELNKLTLEQRQQVAALKEKHRQEQAKGKRGNTPSGPPGGLGPRGGFAAPGSGPRFAPNDPDRPAGSIFFQAQQPPPTSPLPPGLGPQFRPPLGSGPRRNGNGPPGGVPPAVFPPFPGGPENMPPTMMQQPQSADFPIPVGEFDPHKWATDHAGKTVIVCWANDDTVQPGHVYRYRITYKIKNPLFATVNIAKNVNLTKTIALISEPSEWSANVEVPSIIKFWIVRSPSSRGIVPIQIFRWHEGESKAKIFDVSPGDSIGLKEGDIDYTTGWTVVDVGEDPRTRGQFVLLMDAAGNLRKRDVQKDLSDPKFQSMKQQVAGAAASATPKPEETVAGTR